MDNRADDFMIAEFETLRELRQLVVTTGESRVTVYLTLVSGAAVVLALVNQVGSTGNMLRVITGTILASLFVLGLNIFARLIKREVTIKLYTRGMNRVRRYFSDSYPDITRHLALPIDDETPSFRTARFHSLATLVALINSVTVVLGCLILTGVLTDIRPDWAIFAAILLFFLSLLLHYRYDRNQQITAARNTIIRFPRDKT